MNTSDFDRDLLWRYRALPLKIIDGDTCTLLCDVGYGARYEVHLRIAGLNAPELNEPGGFAARVRLATLLPTWSPGTGWPLRVVSTQRETVVSEVRSFERFVGDLYVCQPDGSLKNLKELL